MNSFDYKKINEFNNLKDIKDEIFRIHKIIFDLKIKKAKKEKIKSHLFKYSKRYIAQLNYKLSTFKC